jgi:bifunctional non-homologous end joining protein LigD
MDQISFSMSNRCQTRFVARTLKGAKPLGVVPGFIEPELATLRAHVPPGSEWIHEIKFDGYRMQARVLRGEPTLYTRNGLDWTKRFPIIAAMVARLPAERLILDGEVIVEKDGRPNFSELQADLANPATTAWSITPSIFSIWTASTCGVRVSLIARRS